MKDLIRFIILGGLLWASASFAASRVGGGTMSNVDDGLFSLDIPAFFQQDTEVHTDDSVRLPGPTLFGGSNLGMPTAQLINIYLVRHEFPDLATVTDRDIFEVYFLSRGWTKMASVNPCLEIFAFSKSGGDNMVVGWGGGQGLLLSGPVTRDVVKGIQSAVDSIQLVPGACAWK